MDQITFHHDTVLSDVHMLLPNTRHLMTRLNNVGQPVFLSKFKILRDGERLDCSGPRKCLKKAPKRDDSCEHRQKETKATQGRYGEHDRGGDVESFLDEDGDLNVRRLRKNPTEAASRDLVCPVIVKQSSSVLEEQDESTDDETDEGLSDVFRIEHTMATPLEDVGKQVWRGAFLLADFLLSNPTMFRGSTVLELGAGTGLTSIVMATLAKRVYCTDVGEDLLSMCKRNIMLNRHMSERSGGDVKVRQLDWLQDDFCTDDDFEFSWTVDEVADIHNNTCFIIAADDLCPMSSVCYDDDLTDGLFRTLYRLCSNFRHPCTVFISLEKRFNFTLRHMDVSCEAYDHFTFCLSQLSDLEDGQCRFKVEQLTCNFAQFLLYERIEQLELWKVTATPLLVDEGRLFPSRPGLTSEK